MKKASAYNTATVFVYDASGKLVAEYEQSAPEQTFQAAQPAIGETSYTTADTLGSPRVITDQNGNVTSRRDFLPFGEELGANSTAGRTEAQKYAMTGADRVRQRFTGYEKDGETGLDYAQARYYNNRHGRFTAVDPLLASGKSANPQTFNRYAYVTNNPLILVDPSGMLTEWRRNNSTGQIRWYRDGDDRSDSTELKPEELTYPVGNGYQAVLNPNGPMSPGLQVAAAFTALKFFYSEDDRRGWRVEMTPETRRAFLRTGAVQDASEDILTAMGVGEGLIGLGRAGLSRAAATEASTTETKLFSNLFPEDTPRPIASRELSFDGSKWRATGANGTTITPNGKYNFVVQDGKTFIARPNRFNGLGGHVDLSRGNPVQFAGEIRFGHGNNAGNLRFWTNGSGHFRPNATFSNQAPLPQHLFKPFTF